MEFIKSQQERRQNDVSIVDLVSLTLNMEL